MNSPSPKNGHNRRIARLGVGFFLPLTSKWYNFGMPLTFLDANHKGPGLIRTHGSKNAMSSYLVLVTWRFDFSHPKVEFHYIGQ